MSCAHEQDRPPMSDEVAAQTIRDCARTGCPFCQLAVEMTKTQVATREMSIPDALAVAAFMVETAEAIAAEAGARA